MFLLLPSPVPSLLTSLDFPLGSCLFLYCARLTTLLKNTLIYSSFRGLIWAAPAAVNSTSYLLFIYLLINMIHLFAWFKLNCYNKEISKNTMTEGRWKSKEWLSSLTHSFFLWVYLFLGDQKRERGSGGQAAFTLKMWSSNEHTTFSPALKTDCEGPWGLQFLIANTIWVHLRRSQGLISKLSKWRMNTGINKPSHPQDSKTSVAGQKHTLPLDFIIPWHSQLCMSLI